MGIINSIKKLTKKEKLQKNKKDKRKKKTTKKTKRKKKMAPKKEDMYYCVKCSRRHTKESKIGKSHTNYERSDKTYYCEKCDIRHTKSSKIGKKHKKYDLDKKNKKAKKEKKKTKKSTKKISKKKIDSILKRKDSQEMLKEIAGEKGYKIFKYLVEQGKEINEFKIAEKVKVQINNTRSFLYRLYEYNLVSFSRERDKEKGWFIYSWKAHLNKLKDLLLTEKDEEIAKLKKIEMDAQQIFRCTSCNKDFSYIDAMESTFFCPICGGYLEAIDTEDMHEEINKKIAEIIKDKKEIEEI